MRIVSLLALLFAVASSFVAESPDNRFDSNVNVSERRRLDFVTPQMFGAKGDGVTNDTKAFQRCIAACDSIYVPDGHYIVTLQHRRNPSKKNGIVIDRSNVKMTFSKNAVIQGVLDVSMPKPAQGYDFQYNDYNGCIIWIRGEKNKYIENVIIDGGTFVGVRPDFIMNSSHIVDESGNGIRVYYTKNSVVRNCVIRDNQGDNILAYFNKNLTIDNVKSYDCRRTGISVGPCDGMIVTNCFFYNNGCDKVYDGKVNYATSPMAAICLEGDVPAGAVQKMFNRVVIKNCYCETNSLLSGSDKYVFVGRNTPGFVEIGQLANGGGRIVIEENKIIQKGTSSGAINIHVAESSVKSVFILNNEFSFQPTGGSALSSTSNHLLVSNGNLNSLVVRGNKYTNNVRFVYLYQSNYPSSIKNVTIDGNVATNVNRNMDKQLVESYHGKVDNLIIRDNIHYGRCVELLGVSKRIRISNNRIVGNYTGVSGGALFYCIMGINCKIEIDNNDIEAIYNNNTGQPWYILRGNVEYLDGNKHTIPRDNTIAEGAYVKTGDFRLVNNRIKCKGFYLSMFPASSFNGVVSGNTIVASGYRHFPGSHKPSKKLTVDNNNCESFPVIIVDDRIDRIISRNNRYDKTSLSTAIHNNE